MQQNRKGFMFRGVGEFHVNVQIRIKLVKVSSVALIWFDATIYVCTLHVINLLFTFSVDQRLKIANTHRFTSLSRSLSPSFFFSSFFLLLFRLSSSLVLIVTAVAPVEVTPMIKTNTHTHTHTHTHRERERERDRESSGEWLALCFEVVHSCSCFLSLDTSPGCWPR